MGELKQYEQDFDSKIKMDHFLELYGRWLLNRDPGLVIEILRISKELKHRDPEFKFDAERELFGQGGYFDEKKCA